MLSEEWPLTAKQLHNALKRRHASTSSYQAVHKAAKELVEEGVLQKVDGKLQVSYEWVRKAESFNKRIESSFRKRIDESGTANFTFNSLIELGKFLVNSFLCYPNPEKKECLCCWKHAYPLSGVSQEEHELMKRMFNETTHYAVCNSDTFLDNMTQDYVSKIGKKTVTGKVSTRLDTFVTGDYIMQVYFPAALENDFEKLYDETRSEKDLDMQKLFEFGCKKHEIHVTVSKNGGLADRFRQEAKELYWKNNGAGK